MEQITEEQIRINFEELYDLELTYNKKIGLIVFLDDVKYEFILKLEENSDELVVVGSGALGNRKFDRSRPLFHRHSWNFKRSTIYYNDPTYYVDDVIKGAWCFGTIEDYYLKKIALILDILIAKLNVEYEKVMFYGSSAGGFTSLILATLFKDTLCLVDIPQIYVSRFKSKIHHLDGWRPLKEYYYGDEITDEEFLEMYKYRLNFVDLCKKEKYIPNAYMVLDCSVDLDFNTQYIPFFHELHNLPFTETSNWIKLIITGRHQGHVSVSQNETIKLIDMVFKNNSSGEDDYGIESSPKSNLGGAVNWIKSIIPGRHPDNVSVSQNETMKLGDIIKKDSPKSNLGLVVDRLEKYNTARIDVIIGGEGSHIEIAEIDDWVTLSQPHWLKNHYSGFIITNKNNSIDFKVKCVGDGDLDIKLRGVDRRLDNQRVPIYIIFTQFLVNDESVMRGKKTLWHNTPLTHSKKVKDGEIVKVHVEWLPF